MSEPKSPTVQVIQQNDGNINLTSKQRPAAKIFVLTLLATVSLVLIVNAWHRHSEYKSQQYELVKTSIHGGADQIVQYVKGLRRSVRLFAEKEKSLLKHVAQYSEDIDSYDNLVELVKKDFPNAFSISVANGEGEPYVADFDGFILDVCRIDIINFAESRQPPHLFIHPNPHAYHFDIMVSIDLGLRDKSIFFVSFDSKLIADILQNYELFSHHYYLVNNNTPGLVEVTAKGSRQILEEDKYFLSETQLEQVFYSLPVKGTRWNLVDIPADNTSLSFGKQIWFELLLEITFLILVSVLMLRLLSRSENTVLEKNSQLIKQSEDLFKVRVSVENERKSVYELLERMSNGYINLDNQWSIVNINKHAETFFEEPRKYFIGKNIWDAFPDAVSMLYKILNQAKENDSYMHYEGFYPLLSKWFDLHVYPKDTGLTLFFSDITQRKTQELSIRNSEAQLRAIIESSIAGVITIDENSKIETFNSAAEKLFGYSEKEISGQSLDVLLPKGHKDNHQQYVKNYLRTGIAKMIGFNREVEGVKKDGTVFYMELSIGEAKVGNRSVFTGVAHDVTKRKSAEIEANRAVSEKLNAEDASRAKSTFLANMSHEIRTPLTAIIGFGETLLQSDQTMTERLESVLTIISSGQHLLNLINDILDISKIEAGKLEIENIEVDPFRLIGDVVRIVSPQALEKNLDFSVKYNFPLPKIIISDFVRLNQIIINLLSNALKFTENGYVILNIKCDVENETMFFEIVDSGIGMDELAKQKIFNAFTQADSSTTRQYGGTGLGLSLSQQLANMLGGEITIESKLGAGSCFTLSVKTGKIDKTQLIQKLDDVLSFEEVDVSTELQTLSGHILLAEDNEANQRLLSLMFRKMGVSVEIVEDGKQAVERGLSGNFDLVYMDMQMPIMGGLAAIKELKKNNFSTPIVALTANALQEDKDACIKAGCVDFVTKPITRENLYKITGKYLPRICAKTENPAPIYSSIFDEDPDFVDLLDKFVSELPNIFLLIQSCYEQRNWDKFAMELHKLKGVAGGYGYSTLTELSAKIEFQLLNDDLPEMQSLLRQMDALIKNIMLGFELQSEKMGFLRHDKKG